MAIKIFEASEVCLLFFDRGVGRYMKNIDGCFFCKVEMFHEEHSETSPCILRIFSDSGSGVKYLNYKRLFLVKFDSDFVVFFV
ncbi:hypothetical protein SAMN04488089_101473 [Myroides profundi]|uniref:Uncharacterized protein n=1 Tax=Myroides profundi TaxID=480520 RepID=A0AAJ4W1A4_MYRPR|nr:hypothetical protein SAMN04488089_101473 [Myroides profundi]